MRQDALADLGPSVWTWRLGDTNAAVVGPSVVIHVWAGSDADVESRVGIVVADAVVDVVCGADIVEFWRPEVGFGSVYTRLKASEVRWRRECVVGVSRARSSREPKRAKDPCRRWRLWRHGRTCHSGAGLR